MSFECHKLHHASLITGTDSKHRELMCEIWRRANSKPHLLKRPVAIMMDIKHPLRCKAM
jgi:hypothetical protein